MIATLRRPSTRRSSPKKTSRWRWVWRGVLVVAGLLLVYLLVTFVQVWMASRRDDARPADAIVVMGAAQYNCTPSPVLEERLQHALDLYQSGIANTIVVTGGKRAGDRCTEATAGADYLLANGVPDANVLRENQGANSWESLAAAARILRERDMTRAVLVTDGYHALRVEAIADELGLDAVVSPSHKGGSLRNYAEETAAVSVGRLIGFGRLVHIDDKVEHQLDTTISTEGQETP
ncbi:MAG TPA: YdcF family protein [Acidimicrobiales bacterium]